MVLRSTCGDLRLFAIVSLSGWLLGYAPVRGDSVKLTLQIGNEHWVTSDGSPINIKSHHIDGTNWDVSPGTLTLTLVPGQNPGSYLSASINLSGPNSTGPFSIIYDGNTAGASNSVSISFSASGFDVIQHPVPETATLDGNITTQKALGTGVELVGTANGVKVTDVKPKNAKGPGQVTGTDNKNTTSTDVYSISGVFTFTWDPVNNKLGEYVDLPDSATVTDYGDGSAVPEPASIILLGTGGFAGLGFARRRCREH
jgi:hypothetical protein